MFFHKLKAAVLSVLMVAIAAAGAGYYVMNPFARAQEGQPRGKPRPQPAQTEVLPPDPAQPHPVTKPDNPSPAPGRMFVIGRVLDPKGKPVPNATVMTSGRNKVSGQSVGIEGLTSNVIGHVSADSSGRYRVDALRASSSHNDQVLAVALAPGCGAGWVAVDPDAD